MSDENCERIGKYMKVEAVPGHDPPFWFVEDNKGRCLGSIGWCSGWKQFIFDPYSDSIYSHDCLTDISKYIKRINEEHKGRMKKERGQRPQAKGLKRAVKTQAAGGNERKTDGG